MKNREHKGPEYLSLNPNGKVPTLVDGNLTLFESMAINFYLGDHYKQDLIGPTVQERAPIRQWSFWAITEVQPSILDIFIQRFFVPEDKRDQQKIEKGLESANAKLKILEKFLEGKNYLVANRFTLADLNTASVIEILQTLNFDFTPYPNVSKWLETLQERPAYKKLQERKH
jgi:glutathione S-transferase